MIRFTIPILVALAIVGTAPSSWAFDWEDLFREKRDSVLLHCSGDNWKRGNPDPSKKGPVKGSTAASSRNILMALDGSWIEYGIRLYRTNSSDFTWSYVREAASDDSVGTEIYFSFQTIEIKAYHVHGGHVIRVFEGACAPIENPLQFRDPPTEQPLTPQH